MRNWTCDECGDPWARVQCRGCRKHLCVWCFHHGLHILTWRSWLRWLGRNPA